MTSQQAEIIITLLKNLDFEIFLIMILIGIHVARLSIKGICNRE